VVQDHLEEVFAAVLEHDGGQRLQVARGVQQVEGAQVNPERVRLSAGLEHLPPLVAGPDPGLLADDHVADEGEDAVENHLHGRLGELLAFLAVGLRPEERAGDRLDKGFPEAPVQEEDRARQVHQDGELRDDILGVRDLAVRAAGKAGAERAQQLQHIRVNSQEVNHRPYGVTCQTKAVPVMGD
jgi:hypothetical protein